MLTLAVLAGWNAVSPARAQEANNDAPEIALRLPPSDRVTFDSEDTSPNPLRQAYQPEDERSATASVLRRLVGDTPAPASWDRPRMIFFAGGGDEALVWSPARNAERAQFAYRDDRVEMGDVHAGIGWEAQSATVSLGYIENDYHTPFGSQNQSSASLSLSWRR